MRLHTEKEHLANNSLQIYKLSELFLSDFKKLTEISNHLDILIYSNKKENLDWQWGNLYGLNVFEINNNEKPDFSEIAQKSEKNLLNFQLKLIDDFKSRNDKLELCNYCQKFHTKGKWRWILTSKKIIDENNFFSTSYFLDTLPLTGTYINTKLDNTFDDIYAWQKFQSLTKTEKEILKLIANGKSNKEVAEIRCLSLGTVRKHRENINRKTDIRDLHGLIRFADAFGLIGAL